MTIFNALAILTIFARPGNSIPTATFSDVTLPTSNLKLFPNDFIVTNGTISTPGRRAARKLLRPRVKFQVESAKSEAAAPRRGNLNGERMSSRRP
jgi:hypothetical protein